MRKMLFALIVLISTLSFAPPSSAKPVADEFRNNEYDYSSVKTVLVMPVIYGTEIPDSEPFLDDTLQQKWKELTSPEKGTFNFLVKTPDQIIERESFVKGTEAPEKSNREGFMSTALSLASEYVDAVMTATVTKCGYQTFNHPQEVVWDTRYERRSYYINGKWETRSVPISYQRIKPAWDEKFAVGTVRLELRDSKDNTLIFGANVTAATAGDLFNPLPTLTKHIVNIVENTVKRVPQK